MAIPLSRLGAASDGPTPGPDARPNMLSVGDSLMWGQGLRPDHRFREIVRSRLARNFGTVVELSMARSGAPLDPVDSRTGATSTLHDTQIADTLLARDLLAADNDRDPSDIRWIVLDGGINDVNIKNIVTPAGRLPTATFCQGGQRGCWIRHGRKSSRRW